MKTWLVFLASLLAINAWADVILHVAVTGNDQGNGSEEQPFATVARARDAVRAMITDGLTNNVTVMIHGGVYELPETLVLDSRDSGTKKFSITYSGSSNETVILSGG